MHGFPFVVLRVVHAVHIKDAVIIVGDFEVIAVHVVRQLNLVGTGILAVRSFIDELGFPVDRLDASSDECFVRIVVTAVHDNDVGIPDQVENHLLHVGQIPLNRAAVHQRNDLGRHPFIRIVELHHLIHVPHAVHFDQDHVGIVIKLESV